MALTTRAIVLQRLGLTDDSSSRVAIVVGIDENVASLTIAKSGNTVTLTGVSGGPYDLTAAAYDTLTEFATTLNALTGVRATVATGVDGTLPSTLLDFVSVAMTQSSEAVVGQLTYANPYVNANASLIDALIEETDAAIGRYCNRVDSDGAQTFESGSRDEKYNGDGSDVLRLRNWPVSAFTQIGLIDSSGTETALATTDYRADLVTGEVCLLGSSSVLASSRVDGWEPSPYEGPRYFRERRGWPVGFNNIRVRYTAGWSTVPKGLRSAATQIVVDLFMNRRRSMQSQSEKGTGSEVAYSADELAKRYAQLLDPYKRWST